MVVEGLWPHSVCIDNIRRDKGLALSGYLASNLIYCPRGSNCVTRTLHVNIVIYYNPLKKLIKKLT